jgi:hypothetical protein
MITTRTTDPGAAVRAELRAALHDLSDLLLTPGNHRHVLLDGIRHATALADLAGVAEGLLRADLGTLERELATRPAEVDRAQYARQISAAADRL